MWTNQYNDNGDQIFYCAHVWGSQPLETYGGGSGDKDRIERAGKCKPKKCKQRDFNGKCKGKSSWAWFADIYKCNKDAY